jgi:hypothetical protein
MKKAVAIAAMSALLTLSACNQQSAPSAPAQDEPIKTVQNTTPEPAPAPAPKPEPPKKKVIALNNGKGIINGDFETWEDGKPASWTLENEVVIKGEDDPMEGEACLQTGPGYYFNQISQNVTISGDVRGKVLRFTAWARVAEEETARLMLQFPNGETLYSEPHRANGDWHLLEISHQLREDRSPKRVKVILNHYGKPERSARFDDARITIKDPS